MFKRKFGTKYYETFAALILDKAQLLPVPFTIEWLKDRPDLQIENIGIEVTDSIPENDGQQRKFRQEMLEYETFNDVCQSEVITKENNLNKVQRISDTQYYYLSNIDVSKYDENLTLNQIINRIQDKNEKFSNFPNSNSYENKGLFIFADDVILTLPIFSLDCSQIQDKIDSSIFDVLYLLVNMKLIIFKRKSDIQKEISFEQGDMLEIAIKTMKVLGYPEEEYEKEEVVLKAIRKGDFSL